MKISIRSERLGGQIPPLSSSFPYADYLERYDNRAVPLGLITSDSKLILFTDDVRSVSQGGSDYRDLHSPDVTNGQVGFAVSLAARMPLRFAPAQTTLDLFCPPVPQLPT